MTQRFKKRYPSVKRVSAAEHQGMVREIFTTIPKRYDFLNRVLSLHRDVAWRRFAVERMAFFSTQRLLDLAPGTADVALEAARRYPRIEVVGLDLVREMMIIGARKILRAKMEDRIRLLQGDAVHLPFADRRFDTVSMAFGIRNIPERLSALKEMVRVCVPGGRILILEMHYPQRPFLQGVYHLYLKAVLPCVARAFSRNPGAYNYLSDSIIHFPSPPAFARLMTRAGLTEIAQYPLTLGTTYLHVGIKRA
jgi:demethylmenaquinone methyltransferase/2-methoxy-6-polyprenyl-1,4-benzoquinol methylase